MTNITEQIASTHLGKKSGTSDFYDKSLLVAIPRDDNRKQYKIDSKNLPFAGWDVWHCYEFSAMSEKGVPITRLMKLRYNSDSRFLVESKSLKLYLNSFNMSRFGKNITECLKICQELIQKDMSELLQTQVEVAFLDNEAKRVSIFNQFTNIMNLVDENKLVIENFKESPELLKFDVTDNVQEYYLTFDSLRSNCRVTHQPDFGDAFIYYKSSKHIDEGSLIKYLSSFRSEYHFHEECCEMIYKRLYDLLGLVENQTDELFVCALYTRRGGIDICPARWSENSSIKDVFQLIDIEQYARNSIKQ